MPNEVRYTYTVGGLILPSEMGECPMYITNQDLFQFSMVIISVITLVITAIKKK